MISRASKSSILQGFAKSRSMLAGNAAYDPYAFESIATVTVGAGGSSAIEFTSIPSTYTHLQVRGISRPSEAGTGAQYLYLNMNSDTGTNYARHALAGDGSATATQAAASDTVIRAGYQMRNGSTANIFATFIIDILDYKNTNKYKTIRSLNGFDTNGGGYIALNSGLWMNTNAITTLKLTCEVGNFIQYSSFALYGIKGA